MTNTTLPDHLHKLCLRDLSNGVKFVKIGEKLLAQGTAQPNFGNHQRPKYVPVAKAETSRYRVAPKKQLLAEEAAYTAGHFCNTAESATSNQGIPGICWDPTNQKLKTSSNLTIRNFVKFYSRLLPTRFVGRYSLKPNILFLTEICEQSRKLNNAGLICVPYKHIEYDSDTQTLAEAECPANTRGGVTPTCVGEYCICYVDQYHRDVDFGYDTLFEIPINNA